MADGEAGGPCGREDVAVDQELHAEPTGIDRPLVHDVGLDARQAGAAVRREGPPGQAEVRKPASWAAEAGWAAAGAASQAMASSGPSAIVVLRMATPPRDSASMRRRKGGRIDGMDRAVARHRRRDGDAARRPAEGPHRAADRPGGLTARYQGQAEFLLSGYRLPGNTGTYLDSPFHRHAEGDDLAAITLDRVAGLPGIVVDAAAEPGPVDLDLDASDLGGFAVLVRTGWDGHWGADDYWAAGPYLSVRALDRLIQAGAGLVGVDWPNVDDTTDPARPAHTTSSPRGPRRRAPHRTLGPAGGRVPLLRRAAEDRGRRVVPDQGVRRATGPGAVSRRRGGRLSSGTAGSSSCSAR
jgi:hypothetical protein